MAFVGLVLARYLPDRRFLYGLVVTGAGVGFSAPALLALWLGPRFFLPGIAGLVSALLAGLAAALRLLVVAFRPDPSQGLLEVVMWREILLGVPIALAVSGLVLGAHVVQRTIALPPGGLGPRVVKVDLAASILGLAGALYTLGPLFMSLGLPLNHWTFLGLVLLGFTAFLVVTLLETLTRRRKRRP